MAHWFKKEEKEVINDTQIEFNIGTLREFFEKLAPKVYDNKNTEGFVVCKKTIELQKNLAILDLAKAPEIQVKYYQGKIAALRETIELIDKTIEDFKARTEKTGKRETKRSYVHRTAETAGVAEF